MFFMGNSNALHQDPPRIPRTLRWPVAAICALSIAILLPPVWAQKGGSGGSRGGSPGGTPGGGTPRGTTYPTYPNYPNVYSNPGPATVPEPSADAPLPKPSVNLEEKCLPWDVSEGHDTAVSVTRLQVPSKARSEYDKACDANNKQKFDEAERHARSAIEKFQSYPAAWVILGVVLEEQNKPKDASEACAQAMTVDSKYVPAYLCKAEFFTRAGAWEEVLNVSNLALGLNSAGDGYADYYRAMALFNLNKVAEAKKSALQAVEINVPRNELPLHFLLAHIYESEGNRADATAELRLILKRHNDRGQEDAVKQYLAQLESQPETK